jgi:hypothetical protein
MQKDLAIFFGTGVQEKIVRAIYPALCKSNLFGPPECLSLDRFYRLGLCYNGFEHVRIIQDYLPQPWYDRNRMVKLISLAPYLWQLLLISMKIKHFVFFVDTGVLERSGILFLKSLGCRVAVLQDAMKRWPLFGSRRSLAWFGGGGADLYLLMGERYRPMIRKESSVEIVGSPIYTNCIAPLPPGNNILLVNQCFAKYGEVSQEEEFIFIARVIEDAVRFGPVELRLHPHNDPERYRNLESPRVRVTQNRPLRQSLIDAGIVLVINSTVTLEALALGRPVLTLSWHPSPFDQPVNDVVTRCDDQVQMCAALERWKNHELSGPLDPDALRAVMNGFISHNGDQAKQRIVAALESFVSAL